MDIKRSYFALQIFGNFADAQMGEITEEPECAIRTLFMHTKDGNPIPNLCFCKWAKSHFI
ncbi:hypothetical protein LEP1GSC195_2690 [Leptospira wolbachii serovar Codice str. CDC]|uniref:Uncharacterized protein n=1 Tax=Leptospira wolbachii serovar Codice str. CDC TaxID=1218599 RepID=R9A8U2_9LEPT|nr:hypothetical protein LEP1GSC195_2690 [Leptospira wolbachii serovar Codice str. CDC]